MEKKFCSNCGSELQENARFCQKCGTPTSTRVDSSYQKEGEPKTNRKSLYALLAVVAALLLIICGAIYYSDFQENREIRQAREQFVKDSLEQVRQDSIAREKHIADSLEQARQEVIKSKDIYLDLLESNDESEYYLSDISGDGIPELFVKTEGYSPYDNTYYSYNISIYTVHQGESICLRSWGSMGSPELYYIGKNYLLELSSDNETYCVWNKYEFKDYKEYSMTEEVLYKNYVEDDENFYKEPSETKIKWNNKSNKQPFNKWYQN